MISQSSTNYDRVVRVVKSVVAGVVSLGRQLKSFREGAVRATVFLDYDSHPDSF
jgi:hypothetical protein